MMDLHLSGYCGGKSPVYIATEKMLKTTCECFSLVATDKTEKNIYRWTGMDTNTSSDCSGLTLILFDRILK